TRHGIECYRVYDCEDGDLPLQIDLYGNYLHVCEVEKPEAGSTVRGEGWLAEMAQVAAHTLGIRRDRVFTKFRPRRAPGEQHERRSTESFTTWITESNLHFKVNLSDYLDTGLFLDHRITRGMVADISEGARVLNLFCYTGSFTVYAAAGGAFSTTNVDLSAPYLDWAKENLEANGFLHTGIHTFEHTCAIRFLEKAVRTGQKWDVIVLDAPTFSNSTSMSRTMDIRRDHPELIRRCLSLLPPEGVLVFSTNARGFYLNKRYLSELKPRNLTNETTPEDFARTRPHRTWLFSPQ
ncbi:MAG: class I SAM-dependent methyltransferase, partial [Spirochaetia bacterium]